MLSVWTCNVEVIQCCGPRKRILPLQGPDIFQGISVQQEKWAQKPPRDIQAFSMVFPSQAGLSEVSPSPRTWSHWVRWWRSLLPPLSPGTKARAWEAPHSKVQPQNFLGSESLTFGFLGPETLGITALRGLRLNPKPGSLCDNSVENKGIQNYKGLTHGYS